MRVCVWMLLCVLDIQSQGGSVLLVRLSAIHGRTLKVQMHEYSSSCVFLLRLSFCVSLCFLHYPSPHHRIYECWLCLSRYNVFLPMAFIGSLFHIRRQEVRIFAANCRPCLCFSSAKGRDSPFAFCEEL